MFPNPQDALPIPPHPDIEHYRKISKDLVKACKSNEPESVRKWAAGWVTALVKLSGVVMTSQLPVQTGRWIQQVEEFARRILQGGEPPAKACTLAHAHFVIARSHGFESWPKFTKHVKALLRNSSPESRFEAAADAIVAGDLERLEQLLRDDPELIHARSAREHGATLLHYTSANGVEGFRQKTPKNIVAIADRLIQAGAEVDATANVYGSDCTTLGLAATSVHPERAGVQEALLEKLLDHGASLHRTLVAGRTDTIVVACVANGQPKAAAFLASRGAPLNLEGAAALGRLDIVKTRFDENHSNRKQLESAYGYACAYGRKDIVEFLLGAGIDVASPNTEGRTGLHDAAYGAQVEIVALLVERGCPVEVKDQSYGATALDVALWVWNHTSEIVTRARCYQVVRLLAEAGAKLDPRQWQSGDDRPSPILEEIRGDRRMIEALAARTSP